MTTRLDPAPFYRAALTDITLADKLLDQHPIDHRFGLVFNATFRTLQQLSPQDPDADQRAQMLDTLCDDWGSDLRSAFTVIIIGAFHPDDPTLPTRLHYLSRQDLGHGALCVPVTISSRLDWQDGAFEAFIDQLCTFDHTLGHPWA